MQSGAYMRRCSSKPGNKDTLHRREMDPEELVVHQTTQAFNYFNYLFDPMKGDGNCLHGIQMHEFP